MERWQETWTRHSSYNILGTQLFADGGKYDGDWKDDKKAGKGTFSSNCIGTYIFSNRGRYEGEMADGVVNGQGNPICNPRFLLFSERREV